jgi:hypothetical protein
MIVASSLPQNDVLSLIEKPLEAVPANEVSQSGMYIREDSAQDSLDAQVPPSKMGLHAEPP